MTSLGWSQAQWTPGTLWLPRPPVHEPLVGELEVELPPGRRRLHGDGSRYDAECLLAAIDHDLAAALDLIESLR